jgi:hypothetical protein
MNQHRGLQVKMPSSASQNPQSAESQEGVSSTEEQAREATLLLLERAGRSEPPLIVVDGQDSLAYVTALVDEGGPVGMYCELGYLRALLIVLTLSYLSQFVRRITAPPAPDQWPSPPNQPCHGTRMRGSTAIAIRSRTNFDTPLPASLEYARQAAEQRYPPRQPPCQLSSGVSQTSAGAVVGAKNQTRNDLRALAQWPRLHAPALLSPIVGGIEADPSGIADRYGVKGQSVFTAFVDKDDLSCRVCAFRANTLQLAIFHQRQARHFRP